MPLASFSDIFYNNLPIIGASLGIGLSFAILYLMISRILNDQAMETRAKVSLAGVFETIIVLGGFLLLTWVVAFVISGMFGIPYSEEAHIKLAEASVNNMLSISENMYITSFIYESTMAVVFGMGIPIGKRTTKGWAISTNIYPLQGIHIINTYQGVVMQTLILSMLGTLARVYLIKLSPYLVSFLLPLGVLFRGLHFSRSLGSAILALVLVLYFVFPLSVILSDQLFFKTYKTSLTSQITTNIGNLAIPPFGSSYNLEEASQAYYELATDPELQAIAEDKDVLDSPQEIASLSGLWTQTATKFKKIMSRNIFTLALIGTNTATNTYLDYLALTGKAAEKAKLFKGLKVASLVITLFILFLANPWSTILAFFDLLTLEVFSVGLGVVVLMISLVFEIIIGITLYKELANALGGEALLFGLSKVM